jgi:hypothetical protein
MRRVFTAVILCACLPGCSPSPNLPGPAPSVARGDLLSGDFKTITEVNELPASVSRALGAKPMANPGATFEAGDVIVDASIPRRRLILAGLSTDTCFVHYEQGGYVRSYVLEVFGFRDDNAHKLWSGYCAKPAKSLDGIRSQVASGECR